MKLFLKLHGLASLSFFLLILANFIAGLINFEWIFFWKVPPESTFELIFLNFMILLWGEVLFLIVFRLVAPYALDKADQLLEEGERDEAMEIYLALVKRLIWPRVYLKRIPEMMELTIEWLIDKNENHRAMKIAERAKNAKFNLSFNLQKRISQLQDKKEGVSDKVKATNHIEYKEGDKVKCGKCGKLLRVKYHDPKKIVIVTPDALKGIALRCRSCRFIVCDPCSMPSGGEGMPTCPSCKASVKGPYFFVH